MTGALDELRLAASVFENSREGILITDAEGRILRTIRAFTDIAGYVPEEVVGRNPRLLASGRHEPDFCALMWRSLELTGSWRGEVWNRRRTGEVYPEWLSITTVKDADGRVTHYVGTFADLTDRKRVEEERKHLALHDPLTRLVNRPFFEESLRLEVARALDIEHALALVLVDLCRFDKVNASVGYRAGDIVLSEVAERLKTRLGERGVAGRWYGDQFAIALPLAAHTDDDGIGAAVAALVEDMRGSLASPVSADGHSVQVQACFGVALCPRDARDASALVFGAETALGRAKAKGAGTFCFHTQGMDAEVRERIRLEEEIRAAIAGREMGLHYQPLIDVDSGRVQAAEALLRWHNPRTGDVPPGILVAVAERGGMIAEVGRFILRRACEDLARWRQEGLALPRVAVNVSGQQLPRSRLRARDPRSPGSVLSLLERAGAGDHGGRPRRPRRGHPRPAQRDPRPGRARVH